MARRCQWGDQRFTRKWILDLLRKWRLKPSLAVTTPHSAAPSNWAATLMMGNFKTCFRKITSHATSKEKFGRCSILPLVQALSWRPCDTLIRIWENVLSTTSISFWHCYGQLEIGLEISEKSIANDYMLIYGICFYRCLTVRKLLFISFFRSPG